MSVHCQCCHQSWWGMYVPRKLSECHETLGSQWGGSLHPAVTWPTGEFTWRQGWLWPQSAGHGGDAGSEAECPVLKNAEQWNRQKGLTERFHGLGVGGNTVGPEIRVASTVQVTPSGWRQGADRAQRPSWGQESGLWPDRMRQSSLLHYCCCPVLRSQCLGQNKKPL